MNKKHIQDLLDKYFEGETSLKEERELKKFFNKTMLIPEEWESYKQMFGYFETEGLKTMPNKLGIQKKKNIFWLVGVGISLAATVLILLTVFIPTTKTQLEHLNSATKHLDSFYATKAPTKKSDSTKPIKPEPKKTDKIKSVTENKISRDDKTMILAVRKDEKAKATSLNSTINDALAPLDQMKDIDIAMDKFKYFDLMNKYLPNIDMTSLMQNAK